jgi:hypothetical protein
MLNIGVESFVWGTVCSGRVSEACQGQFGVFSGQCELTKSAVQGATGQEAFDGLRDEAAHDALSLDVDSGVDFGPFVELDDVVGDVHLQVRPNGGQPQGLIARLVDLDVERQLLAAQHARDASPAAGGQAIRAKPLDLERDRGPARDRARPGQDVHDLLRLRTNCCVGCPCHVCIVGVQRCAGIGTQADLHSSFWTIPGPP